MAKTIDIDLIINTAGSEKSVAQAKDAIVQLQRELKNLGDSADDAFVKKTNNAIAQSKAQLQDLKDDIDSIRPDKVGSAFLTLGQSIAGAFQVASGALSAFGVEGKTLEETQTKLLAISNVAGGLANLSETTEDFSRSFKVLNTVIKQNPIIFIIGAIIGVFTILASKSQALQKVIGGVFKVFEILGEGIDIIINSTSKLIDGLFGLSSEYGEVSDEARKAAAALREFKNASADLNSQIDIEVERTKLLRGEISQEAFDRIKLQKVREGADRAAEAEYQKRIDEAAELAKEDKAGAEAIIDNAILIKENKKILNEEIFNNDQKALENNIEQTKKKESEAAAEEGKRKSKERAEERQRRIDDEQKALEEFNEQIKKINEEQFNEFQKISKEEFDAKKELQTKFDKLTAEEQKSRRTELEEGLSKIELDAITKTNELKKQKEDEAIQAEKDRLQKLSDTKQLGFENQLLELELNGQLTREKELAIEKQKFEDLKLLTEEGSEEQKALILQNKETLLEINKKYNEKELEDDRKKEEQKARNLQFGVQSAIQAANLISDIATKFAGKSQQAARKAFNISKAAQIASAIGTTYLSATQAFASQFVPIPDPTSPVRGGIAAGLAVAAGLANVAKIAQTKFEGNNTTGPPPNTNIGDLGGGNIPNTSTPATPQSSIINQQIGGINQDGFRVFVTETDITSVINKVDVIESQSKFG